MASSPDVNGTAEHALEQALDDLEETHIRHTIDEPIDRAAASFRSCATWPVNQHLFHQTISAFVQHMYEYGIPLRQQLSPAQALREAIALLDRTYPAASSRRHDSALLDATNPNCNGMDGVLGAMAEAIKAREKQNYVSFVLTTRLSTLSWAARKRVAEILLQRLAVIEIPVAAGLSAEWGADHIPDLINTYMRLTQDVSAMCAARSRWSE